MKNMIRHLMANIYSYWLIMLGKLNEVKKRAKNKEIILSVYFHNPSKKLFEKCIKWFVKNGFIFIDVNQMCDIIKNKKDFPKSAVLITIDDGWKNNRNNVVDTAIKYKIPITIFATTEPIFNNKNFWWRTISEANKHSYVNISVNSLKIQPNNIRLKYLHKANKMIPHLKEALSTDEIKEINKHELIQIGSHTHTHPILPQCDDKTSFKEIFESKNILENKLKNEIKYFAYPNGDFSKRECEYLEKCGYQMAFTTEPKYIETKKEINIFQIPRFGIVDNVSFIENVCRMTGIWYERKNYKK